MGNLETNGGANQQGDKHRDDMVDVAQALKSNLQSNLSDSVLCQRRDHPKDGTPVAPKSFAPGRAQRPKREGTER